MRQIVLLAACGLLVAHGAMAQNDPTSKVFLAINGSYQLTAKDFTDGAIKRENAEDGRFDTTYSVKAGPAFDVAGGARVWRQLAVGAEVSRVSTSTPTHLSGSIPHPFFFNRQRAAANSR